MMKLDNHDKIAISATGIVLVALWFFMRNGGALPAAFNLGSLLTPVNLPQSSTNVPFWLQNNNYPQGSSGFQLPLPVLTNSTCETCSLFPSQQPALGFNTL